MGIDDAVTSKAFTGGEALEKRLAEMAKNLEKGASVSVGFPEGATEQDGTGTALVAFMQEFGAPGAGIPPRPFFRPMIAEKSPGWGDAVASNLKATDYDAAKALGLLGEEIANDLQDSIVSLDSPALSPVTLMLRKMFPVRSEGVQSYRDVQEARARVDAGESAGDVSTKPLIWTHQMINSIVSVVK